MPIELSVLEGYLNNIYLGCQSIYSILDDQQRFESQIEFRKPEEWVVVLYSVDSWIYGRQPHYFSYPCLMLQSKIMHFSFLSLLLGIMF